MTIPTREEALIDLDSIDTMFDALNSSVCDEHISRLRSYIESHTGEVAAWRMRSMQPGREWTTFDDPKDYETLKRRGAEMFPLYASPVQPALEWNGDHLEFNGVKIGNLIKAGGGGEQYHSFTVYDCPTKAMKRSDKIVEMEQRARQWLSGGNK